MTPPFQPSPLRQVQTTGLPGEVAREGPTRAGAWILNSGGQANVVGFAFHKVADREAEVGGTGEFVGILGRPKEHALVGVGASALTPTDILADGIVGNMITMGILFLQLDGTGAAGTVGTGVYSNDVTGSIAAGAAGAGETQIPNASIVLEDVAAGGLAIVSLTN